MNDNLSAFNSHNYDTQIKKTLPYYDLFYGQVIDLVKTMYHGPVTWLDVGCGTGKMAQVAFETVPIESFVFCDSSIQMIQVVKERFPYDTVDFCVCDVQDINYSNAFDVITAIQVNHYLSKEDRKRSIDKCYASLKENGVFISFENFAPFTNTGKNIYLNKWKNYQLQQGKSMKECETHISRYGKEYFPITITEHIELLKKCGFKTAEILWVSNMQMGIWGQK